MITMLIWIGLGLVGLALLGVVVLALDVLSNGAITGYPYMRVDE